MARWRMRWIALAGGLACYLGLVTQAPAQGPGGYQPPMAEGGYPGGPSPGPAGGPGDEFPRLGAKKPAEPTGPPQHPLSMDYHGTPNAFCDEEYYPEPVPYVLKIRGEYLLWHVGMPRLSTVIATTNSNANLTNGFGAIGDPGTTSLLGPGTYDYHNVSGGRITAGLALGIMPPIELSGFWLSRSLPSLFGASSDGSATGQVLARPFQAPNLPSLNGLGQQVVLTAGFPGLLAGNINVGADLNYWGIELNALINLGTSERASLDVLVGYRYSSLSESLNISNSLATVSDTFNLNFNAVNTAGFPQGFVTTASDIFKTHNQFNGATFGLRPTLYVGAFTSSVDLKMALGSTHQTLNVSGASSLISPDGSVQTVPGGLLAVASNSGVTSHDVFSIIPEINVNVGFNLTRNVRFFATYNIFAWTNVVRPGDQLNSRIDSRQVPTDPTFDPTFRGTTPAPSFVTSSFWGQGVSVGIEIGF